MAASSPEQGKTTDYIALEGTAWGVLLDVMQNDNDQLLSLTRYPVSKAAGNGVDSQRYVDQLQQWIENSGVNKVGMDAAAWLQHPERWLPKQDKACKGWGPGNKNREPWSKGKKSPVIRYLEVKNYLTCESYRSRMQINVWNMMSATLAEKTRQSARGVPVILGVSVPMPANNGDGIALKAELPALIKSNREEWVAIHLYGSEECRDQKNKPDFKEYDTAMGCQTLTCEHQLNSWKTYWLDKQKQNWRASKVDAGDGFTRLVVRNRNYFKTTIICFDWKDEEYAAHKPDLKLWPYGITVEGKNVLNSQESAFPQDYLEKIKNEFEKHATR
jgi:hypothetical protein